MQRQKKFVYTRSLGRIIAREAKTVRPGRFHIISWARKGHWGVVADKALRALRVLPTKNAAVSFVKKYRQRSAEPLIEIIIHDRNGGVENIISLPLK